jgi:hypothetical protein
VPLQSGTYTFTGPKCPTTACTRRALPKGDAQRAASVKEKDMDVIALYSADALLFDLGGVVIEIDFDLVFARWAAHAQQPLDTIKAKFSFDAFYERHERGEIDAAAYFASLRTSLSIDISDPQFVDGWNAIYVREIPGIVAFTILALFMRRVAPSFL